MDDMLPQPQADAMGALLTGAGVTTAQWQAALRAVQSEFAWQLEKITLSRTGLAGVVDLIGRIDHTMRAPGAAALCGEASKANGYATLGHVILDHVLGGTDHRRALAARASRSAGWRGEIAMPVLANLAVATMAELVSHAHKGLGGVLDVLPPLGRHSRGSPYADLADIVRRGCGAGPYAPARLRRVVRRCIAQAASFPARGPLSWYVQFILVRPLSRPMRAFIARTSPARPVASNG
jgi:hypothetical protein